MARVFIFSALSLWLSGVAWFRGGNQLVLDGFLNEPLASILMVMFWGLAILFFVLGLVIRAISRDIREHLKYLDQKDNPPLKIQGKRSPDGRRL